MTIKQQLSHFYSFLDNPLFGWSRIALLVLVVPLALAFTQPLWRISLHAPQYPDGLWMEIYTHKVEGGRNGQHIAEINTLNHYIGMHKIDRGELSDLDWMPFALGLLLVLALRCAAIGNIRALIDLVVLTGYISVFAFGRFVYKLYVFGHNLDPSAPLKVKPFTPAIFGTKQIANFTTTSSPQFGSILIGVFSTGVLALLAWHLIKGRSNMRRVASTPSTQLQAG
jgi:copper chaperone NosL